MKKRFSFLLILFIFLGCLKAKRSGFDISSPSGLFATSADLFSRTTSTETSISTTTDTSTSTNTSTSTTTITTTSTSTSTSTSTATSLPTFAIQSFSLTDGEIRVGIFKPLILTFDSPPLSASFMASTIILKDSLSTTIDLNFIYTSGNSVTLEPKTNLGYGKTYTLTIKSGDTGVIGVNGGKLIADKTYTFTTADFNLYIAGGNGINVSATRNAYFPHGVVFQNIPYVIWSEDKDGSSTIFNNVLKRFETTSWTNLTPNSSDISNNTTEYKRSFQTKVYNLKNSIYVTWIEYSGSPSLNNAYHMFVKKLNGTTFSQLGSSHLNENVANSAIYPSLVEYNSQIYAIHTQVGPSPGKIVIKKFNESTSVWESAGNIATADGESYTTSIVFNNKLYIGAYHKDGGSFYTLNVYVFNTTTNSWDSAGSSIQYNGSAVQQLPYNFDSGSSANPPITLNIAPSFAVFNGKLYIAWSENSTISSVVARKVRVKVYNGNDSAPVWSFVDGGSLAGLNHDSSKNGDGPSLAVYNNKLFMIWAENNGTVYQARLALYNGNDSAPVWNFVDGTTITNTGLNLVKTHKILYPNLFSGDKLYATWIEENTANANTYQVQVIWLPF